MGVMMGVVVVVVVGGGGGGARVCVWTVTCPTIFSFPLRKWKKEFLYCIDLILHGAHMSREQN